MASRTEANTMISTKTWDQIGRLRDGKCTGSSHHHKSVALAPRAMYFQAEEPASPMSKRKHKRRAARACLACRARKVRCDVVESIPCRNCKWDGIDCVLQEGRRKHRNAGPASSDPSAGVRFIVVPAEGDVRQEAVHSPPGSSKSQSVFDESEAPTLTPSTNPPSTADDEEMCDVVTRAIPGDHLETAKSSSSCHGCPRQSHSLGQLLSSMARVLRKSSWDADHTPSSEAVQARESIITALPKFITPPPVDLDLDSLRHLHSSGALQLPPSASQCELLRAYARGVHYSMPCVDIHDVIRAQSSRSGSRGSVSLVLYQSLMFAGAMYVKSKALKDMGYSSRPAALKDLYRRAKLLYSLEYDKDPLSIVQTLLLLSLRSPSSSKQDTPSFWTHLAIGVIRQEKMHCEAGRAALPKHEASIWKRLWWCCIVRDTFNALGACQAPSIRGDDCEISFLELDDFDVAPFPKTDPSDPSACTTEEQTRLAELFIELGDLSLRLARVLHHQFRGLGPNAPADDGDELIGSLKQWYQDLPPSCHAESPPVTSWNDRVSLVHVQRCFLHMTYHAALLTFHRNGIVPAVSSDREDPGTSLAAQSANSILQIAAGLVTSELDDLMPVMGVTLLLPALLVHSLDAAAHAANYEIAQDAHQSLRILEKMKDRFEFADMAACYLQPFREASQGSSRAKGSGHGEPDHEPPTARLSAHSSLPKGSTTPRCIGTEMPDSTAASSSMVDTLGDLSPDYLLQTSQFDPKVLEELDSLSAEAYSFEQLMENSLDDTPDFANWTSSSPAANDSKDHPIHSPSHVDVVKSQQSDGRAQDIFHHIEEEIVQILALN